MTVISYQFSLQVVKMICFYSKNLRFAKILLLFQYFLYFCGAFFEEALHGFSKCGIPLGGFL